MALTFTVLKGKVVPDTTLLMRPEFQDILDYGAAKKKEELANQMLLYIFYCCDLTNANPIAKVDHRMKEDQAKKMAFGKSPKLNVKEQSLIDSGIDAYNFCNETSLERATMAFDQKIDEIRTLLDQIKPEQHAVLEEPTCTTCQEDVQVVIEKYVSNAADIEKFGAMLDKFA